MRIPERLKKRRLTLQDIEESFYFYNTMSNANHLDIIVDTSASDLVAAISSTVRKKIGVVCNETEDLYDIYCTHIKDETGIDLSFMAKDYSMAEFYDDFKGYKQTLLHELKLMGYGVI